ncbi:MAG TPA: hypothetical protein VGL81_03110 [Polyangiaceae bacterium]
MKRKVVPLRPNAPADEAAMRPRTIPRVISHAPGLSRESLVQACKVQEKLIAKYEARITGLVAKILQDKLPPIESWVAAVLTSPGPGDEEDLVEIAPREQAIEIAQPWPSIDRGLRDTPLPDRLDVIVEAMQVIGLVSIDVDPALPVTRKQAEAANLPAHLLFARGEAFASVGEEPADGKALQAAFEAHRDLVDENADDLLDRLRTNGIRTPLGECVGVLLALGPEGNACSVVTREQAAKLLADKPFLARKLARRGSPGKLSDGREIIAIPIVVWAKGHVSVQTREIVEAG